MNRFVILLAIPVICVGACDKKKSSSGTTTPPVMRSGEIMHSVGLQYFDGRPSVSSDGTQLAFISGREMTATGDGALKAFKVDTTNTAAVPARVSSSDIGVETDVIESPNGSKVALIASQNGIISVYLTDWAGTAPVAVTLPAGQSPVLPVTFNDAGTALAFGATSATDGIVTKTFYVGAIAGDLSVSLATVPACASACQANVGWLGATSTLVLSASNTTTSTAAFYKVDASTPGTPGTPTLWAEGLRLATNVPPVVAASGAWLVTRVYPLGSVKNPRSIPIRTMPMSLAAASGSTPVSAGAEGFDVITISSNTLGSALLWIERDTWTCSGIEASGTPWVLSNGTSGTRFYARSETAAGTFTMITDPCALTRDDKTAGALDKNVSTVVLSGSSTPAAASFAYMTIVSGDAEIQFGTFDGTTGTSRDVSNNKPAP